MSIDIIYIIEILPPLFKAMLVTLRIAISGYLLAFVLGLLIAMIRVSGNVYLSRLLLMFTEFISSEGLIREAGKSTQKLDIYDFERPIGIQIFGNNIDNMIEATRICEQANPEIIDINYGCPVPKVTKKGAGSAALKDLCLMDDITRADHRCHKENHDR